MLQHNLSKAWGQFQQLAAESNAARDDGDASRDGRSRTELRAALERLRAAAAEIEAQLDAHRHLAGSSWVGSGELERRETI